MTVLLELREISLGGRAAPRLDAVSLRLRAGETVALIGPSGAGKSSLLSVANGCLTPDAGTVRWRGKPVQELSRGQRRRIGTLWQELHLVEELTVAQNVNIGALGHRSLGWAVVNLLLPLERETCRRCILRAGLPADLLDRRVTSLSGGQRQRVALARLLRQQPSLVLADEPLSSLDPALVDDVLKTLLNRAEDPGGAPHASTTVICLHRPDLLHRFDRVIAMKRGRVHFDARPGSVSKDQLNALYSLSSRHSMNEDGG